jgi:hypothetical protein
MIIFYLYKFLEKSVKPQLFLKNWISHMKKSSKSPVIFKILDFSYDCVISYRV